MSSISIGEVVTLGFLALIICSMVHSQQFKLDSAPYKVLKEMDGYEIREYPATNWVSSDSQAMEVYDSEESRELFMKLFLYISGGNRKAAKIPMTSPVSMEIHPGAGPNCKSNFTMSFYLDPKFQKNPPKPKDKDVYIESRPAMKIAAIRFGGFPTNDIYIEKSRELFNYLERDGVKVKYDYFYFAGYNSPFERKNRRQEVWDVLEVE